VRVQQLSESGREIVLYRITGGDTCVLTTASLLAHQHYAAEAIAETAVDAIALPRDAFDRLMADSATFRDFVFRSYASRLTNLLLLVEEVAFGRMDTRLAERLVARCGADGIVALTHHDLAVELGTAREVVSRQLKEFERRGWVTLERGRVIVTDEQGLRTLSRPS
jgi:CRP/FNR family transcriptional regulator